MSFSGYQHHHKRGAKAEDHVTHEEIPEEHGLMETISDFIGSVPGIITLASAEVVYIALAQSIGFDHFPFNFLTLVLSVMALQISQVIIVVQNRQGAILEKKAARERAEVTEDLEMGRQLFALVVDLHDKLLPDDQPHDIVDVPAEVDAARKA